MKIPMFIFLLVLLLLSLSQCLAAPVIRDISGLTVQILPLSGRVLCTIMSILSIVLVTSVYTILIRRGSLMASTCLYLSRPIEQNIGSILNQAWPESGDSVCSNSNSVTIHKSETPSHSISLFYLGRLTTDPQDTLIAKGRIETQSIPISRPARRPLWLTSGSALTKNVVQILIWEWVSLWLVLLMAFATMLFNGFFTSSQTPDSIARLIIMLLYVVAYTTHFCYVWVTCLAFFREVSGGAAWSLLERAKFVVAESKKLRSHTAGSEFQFRSIDKSSERFVPQLFRASLGVKHPTHSPVASPPVDRNNSSTSQTTYNPEGKETDSNPFQEAELSAAIGTILDTQKSERHIATDSSVFALDRVIANAMVMMGITLSSGFVSWTSSQLSEETPNNLVSSQIGSLALLASFSLGAAAMFTSAMHLNIMATSFTNILSLKETKINGLAVDHYHKRRGLGGPARSVKRGYINTGVKDEEKGVEGEERDVTPIAFTRGTAPLADMGLVDLLSAAWRENEDEGKAVKAWQRIRVEANKLVGVVVLGPAFAMLPQKRDYDRTSNEVDFEMDARLAKGRVVFTTGETDRHRDGEGINVCWVPEHSVKG